MSLNFSENPGPYERHLKRKYNNPLFGDKAKGIDQARVDAARLLDEEQLHDFLTQFRSLVQQAVELEPNADSETILAIKDQLDQSYSLCCSLANNQPEIRQAIDRLIDVIMAAIRKGAENDPEALKKLEEEEAAREIHKQLQSNVLVADLMLEDSPIEADELVPTLLSEDHESLPVVLSIFEAEQLQHICQDAVNLLEDLEARGIDVPAKAQTNLQIIETWLLENTELGSA